MPSPLTVNSSRSVPASDTSSQASNTHEAVPVVSAVQVKLLSFTGRSSRTTVEKCVAVPMEPVRLPTVPKRVEMPAVVA
jgi:hypothetical protein